MNVEASTPLEFRKSALLIWVGTIFLGLVPGLIRTVILIGVLVLGLVNNIHLVFCIMGAIACANGQVCRVPFARRLLK